MKKIILSIHLIFFGFFITKAQIFDSTNGYELPNTGTIRILFIFAELDCTTCPPVGDEPSNIRCKGGTVPEWLPGTIPLGLDEYIDADIDLQSPNPQGKITKFFREASFGSLNVLGDYYDQILSVPCDTY